MAAVQVMIETGAAPADVTVYGPFALADVVSDVRMLQSLAVQLRARRFEVCCPCILVAVV
jgi:hypothetical protein